MKTHFEQAEGLSRSGQPAQTPAEGGLDTECASQSFALKTALKWEEIQGSFGPAFVENAYRALLGREPNSAEREYRLGELRNGAAKIQILTALRRSPEGRRYCHTLKDSSLLRRIDAEIAKFGLSRIPFFGRVLRWALGLESDNQLERNLRSIEYRILELTRRDEWSPARGCAIARNSRDLATTAGEQFGTPVDERPLAGTEIVQASQLPVGRSPAQWQGEYCLPQGLRDFILDCFGEDLIPVLSCWMSIIAEFGDSPINFENSPQFEALLGRLRQQATAAKLNSPKPSVSIIVPVHNALVFTLTCISSILQFSGSVSLEILVGDDKSTDATAEAVGSIGECVRVISQPSNLGFLENCNSTVLHARGDIVIFLNNDTLVLPGWLDALIAPLSSTDVGLSGSKLINADGTLQEAGGIVWRDGSAWNYGRGQDPRLPEFNYSKEVDYISGASIALRTTTWHDLGGFDPHYAPAYCEDTDLAFRVRARGLKVLYQPRSALIHHEGRSHGRDTSSGIKAYQVTNSGKFVERWRQILERDHFANGEHVFVARDRSRYKPHILFIDHYVPQWDRDAGSRTMLHYLKLFVDADFQVTLWPDNLYEDVEYVRRFQEMGIEVIYSAAYVGRFDTWIRQIAHWINYVYLSRPHISIKYLDAIKTQTKARILYYGHDLHFLRCIKEYLVTENETSLKEAMSSCSLELKICGNVDAVLYPGFEERHVLRAILGPEHSAIAVIPVYLFDNEDFASAERQLADLESRKRRHIMFVGGFSHSPNVDGILWFVREVMPLLQRVDPGFFLSIAGSNAPPSIQSMASDRIRIRGRISDEELEQLYKEATVAIVPLRYGAGVKGKLIEAMAAAIPIVTTSVGVQGIDGSDDLVFLGDTPSAFAEAVLLANSDMELARRKIAAGIKFLRGTHSTEAARAVLAPFIPQFNAHLSGSSVCTS